MLCNLKENEKVKKMKKKNNLINKKKKKVFRTKKLYFKF